MGASLTIGPATGACCCGITGLCGAVNAGDGALVSNVGTVFCISLLTGASNVGAALLTGVSDTISLSEEVIEGSFITTVSFTWLLMFIFTGLFSKELSVDTELLLTSDKLSFSNAKTGIKTY